MPYPEHEKLKKIRDQSQACYDFIEWLGSEKAIFLGMYETVTKECQSCGHVEAHGWLGGCEANGCECAHAVHGNPERMHQWTSASMLNLLSEHFGIDQDVLEDEKRAMLDGMRAAHVTTEAAS